jgi:hypothetical protein
MSKNSSIASIRPACTPPAAIYRERSIPADTELPAAASERRAEALASSIENHFLFITRPGAHALANMLERDAVPARTARAAAGAAELLRSVLPGWRSSLDLLSAVGLSLPADRRLPRCSTTRSLASTLQQQQTPFFIEFGSEAKKVLWSRPPPRGVASSRLSGFSASVVPRRRTTCPAACSSCSTVRPPAPPTSKPSWRPCTPAALRPPSAPPSECSRPCSVSDPTRASRFRPPRPNWSSTPRTVSLSLFCLILFLRCVRTKKFCFRHSSAEIFNVPHQSLPQYIILKS